LFGFDQNGSLSSAMGRRVAPSSVVSTDSGFFSLSSTNIVNLATSQSSSFSPCSDQNGAQIPNCSTSFDLGQRAIGLGANIWFIRYVGSTDNWRAELVAVNTDGQVQQILALPGQLRYTYSTLSVVSGQLRVSMSLGSTETALFNISVQPRLQIQAAGSVGFQSSGKPLGNGDWLVASTARFTQVTPVAFTGSLAPISANFEFARAPSMRDDQFDTNALGDSLVSFEQRNTPYVSRFEWRDAQGHLILNRSDLLAAKFEPSGNLLVLVLDRSSAIPVLKAQRIGRNGAQIGETEGFSDVAIKPSEVSLYRGPNNTLLALNAYLGERENAVYQIDLDGNKARVAQLSPSRFTTPIYAAGSPWISQGRNEVAQIESVNILTGARYFIPAGGRKIAVGDAIYEFSDNAGLPGLRIHRAGQSGTVALPAVEARVISYRPVNPALANQDELRFVLQNTATGEQIVMSVTNGQAVERFRSGGVILSDGSLLSATGSNQWRKFKTDGTIIENYPVCGDPSYPLDDGKGGVWTSRRAGPDENQYFTMCYTSPNGVLSEALTPAPAVGNASLTEDGDFLQLTGSTQTRFRVVDGVVRHHTRLREFVASPDSRPAINIGDKLYFSSTRQNLSDIGLPSQEALIEQIDLIPTAAVIDQYASSGFE
jgi:hypothetical protein